jgi:hypothetical protein
MMAYTNDGTTVILFMRNTQVTIDAAVADLADDWLSTAHIGVTASTGELSDNHDVIRIETFR